MVSWDQNIFSGKTSNKLKLLNQTKCAKVFSHVTESGTML